MKTKPKVIHLIQSLNSGGCENMLLRTLPHMPEFDHILITLARPGELAPRFEEQGFTVMNIGYTSFLDFKSLKRLVSEVNKAQPALIITYLFHADMMGRLYLQKYVRAPIVPFLRTTYNNRAYWLPRLLEQVSKGRVRHYLANSDAVKQFYTRHLGVTPAKITVIPNGLDLQVFEQAQRQTVRQELGLAKGSFVICCVANLAANKGHRSLLQAFEEFYAEKPNSYLVLVGQGPELQNLKRQLTAYKSGHHVLFLGRRHDIPNILKSSDLFVLPTLFEGMSNAILEAMAAELAVITTDIPENRTVITHRENGWLIKPGSHIPIVEALKTLAMDPDQRQALGRCAKQSIAERFSLHATASRWSREIEKLIR